MGGAKTISRLLIGLGIFNVIMYAVGALAYGIYSGSGWFIFALCPLAGGLLLARQSRAREEQGLEKRLLALAARHDHYITAAEVALETDLSLEEAGQALERMRKKGHMALKVADNGVYVYECLPLLSLDEKRDAERI